MKIPIEFRSSTGNNDPFDDDLDAGHLVIQGKLIHYAEKIFQRQHRTFIFSIIVMGCFARIIRWDRSGAVVTHRFDYVQHPEYLGDFFWRFSHASSADQGYDPSAELILEDSDEYEFMDRVASKELEVRDYAREYFKESLGDPTLDPEFKPRRWKLSVTESASGSTRHFLVGMPFYLATEIIGRGTHVFVALDCKTEKFVCLKDVWRVIHVDIDQEGVILRRLNELKIENVPTLCIDGDVENQHTFTDRLWKELYPEIECPFRTHAHYRIVEEEVCRPLSDFKNGHELLKLTNDCFQGTSHSFETSVCTDTNALQLIERPSREQISCTVILVRGTCLYTSTRGAMGQLYAEVH